MRDVFTRHRTIALGSISAHVAEAGEGPPIVLLHGNPDSHAVWSGVVEQLAGTHSCIAPDLPGFGDTRAPDFDCAIEHQGGYIGELLDALALERVHLVVHDIGAVFGLTYATYHPERLRSITIFNNSFFPHHFWARVWQTRGLGELAMALSNRRLFVSQLRRGSPKMPREYAEHAYAAFSRDTKRMALRWYRVMRREIDGWDTRFVEATARVPKQVVWGDLDPFVPLANADRFGAPVQHVGDCGHWVMVEDPALAATAIRKLT